MNRYHEHCLVCDSSEFGVLHQRYAHAYLVKCENCGLIFCSRIPTPEELLQHYEKYPRNASISPLTIKRYEELLAQFEPYRRTNRILDIGCGDGHFLAVAKSKGWNVFGTEFTDDAVAICRGKGIEMHKGIIQSWSGDGNFDVITSFEVLEHITDGREHTSKIFNLLRTGGLFYFTTPNFNSISRRWLGGKWKVIEYPEHLCYYTPSTITRLLNFAGLKKLEVLTTGITLRKVRVSPVAPARNNEELLRTSIEENAVLRLVKRFLNWYLNLFKAGDSLKGYFVK